MPPAPRLSSHRRASSARDTPPLLRSSRRITHSSDGPPTSLGRRHHHRATPREQRYSAARWRRDVSDSGSGLTSALAQMERANERLGELSSTLSNMFDGNPASRLRSLNLPNIDSYLFGDAPNTDEHDDDHTRRRAKRRRLDLSDEPNDTSSNYGYYGQVAAGPLKMEMVSCDGGQLSGERGSLYQPENLLRNDKSVYCTEHQQCNILLCHPGETLFSLQKLIIKGPDKGFTAPYVLSRML